MRLNLTSQSSSCRFVPYLDSNITHISPLTIRQSFLLCFFGFTWACCPRHTFDVLTTNWSFFLYLSGFPWACGSRHTFHLLTIKQSFLLCFFCLPRTCCSSPVSNLNKGSVCLVTIVDFCFVGIIVFPQSWNMSLRSQLPRPESLNRRLIGPRLIKVFKLWMSDPSKRRMSQVLKASLWSKNSSPKMTLQGKPDKTWKDISKLSN